MEELPQGDSFGCPFLGKGQHCAEGDIAEAHAVEGGEIAEAPRCKLPVLAQPDEGVAVARRRLTCYSSAALFLPVSITCRIFCDNSVSLNGF